METKKGILKKRKLVIKHDNSTLNADSSPEEHHQNFEIAFINDSEPAENKL